MTPPDIVSWDRESVLPVVVDAIRLLTEAIERTSGDPEWTIGHAWGTTVDGPSRTERHVHASGVVVDTNNSQVDNHVQFGILELPTPAGRVLTISVPVGRVTTNDPGAFMPHALEVLSAIPRDADDGTGRIARIGQGIAALASTRDVEVRHVRFTGHLPDAAAEEYDRLVLEDAGYHHIDHPLVGPLSRVVPSMMVVRTTKALLRVERAVFHVDDRTHDPMSSLRAAAELRTLLGDAS